jgi:hypothetical protein
VTWKVGKPKTLVTCIDVTASVPRSLIRDSEAFLGRELMAEPKPGSGAVTGYIRTITDNSVNPSNNLLTVQIPAVPAPTKRKLSIFDPHKQEAQRQYEAALAREQKALSRARARARDYAAKIETLDPRTENRGTDLYACPAVATRLILPNNPSWLFVVSDLLPSNANTNLKFSLPGTRAVIFQYCSQDLPACQQRIDTFTGKLKQVGASRTDVYDITQIRVLQHALPGF